MTEPNPYQAPDGEPEYQWGPEQPYGYPQSGGPAHAHPPEATLGYGTPGHGTPGYGYPPPAAGWSPTQAAGVPVPAYGPAPGGAPLVGIGDITVLQDSIVTPAGTMPLRGAVWNATDLSRTEESIPAYAIVLAIVFFLACLLGLLFLLIKERKTTGFIQVTVTSGGKHHSTMIPAHSPVAFQHVMSQVNYARSISSM
ncbi:hypothetical protein [Streptomyces sp. CAU 1734]|uniref:hypothetical protein n=1 Tax=Streptomyces sp. CAU 1734 TaxID=3140360 RepID=UPI003261C56D